MHILFIYLSILAVMNIDDKKPYSDNSNSMEIYVCVTFNIIFLVFFAAI